MSVELDPLDAVRAAPEHHKVLFENDTVRVLETVLKSGEETKVHTHVWAGTLYIVSWSDFIRFDDRGGVMLESKDLTSPPQAGTTVWAPPLPPHSLRNVGSGVIHVILTEIKTLDAEDRMQPTPLPAQA